VALTVALVGEQAVLYISVLDADGNRLVLNQKRAKVGTAVSGKQVKTIHNFVIVPRSIPIQMLVPKNLLVKGQTYMIHVIAVDADGTTDATYLPRASGCASFGAQPVNRAVRHVPPRQGELHDDTADDRARAGEPVTVVALSGAR
jgi:hypothetical protein